MAEKTNDEKAKLEQEIKQLEETLTKLLEETHHAENIAEIRTINEQISALHSAMPADLHILKAIRHSLKQRIAALEGEEIVDKYGLFMNVYQASKGGFI